MMRRIAQNRFKALTSVCVLSMMATVAWSQGPSIRWLGTLGGDWSSAFGVSADGSVVVGRSRNSTGQEIAFRWTALGGMQSLGTFGGDRSGAVSVSANGNIVVGWAYDAQGRWRAFRWENNQMQDLGTLGGNFAQALGISADGSVIVGSAYDSQGIPRAFRWTQQTGMVALFASDWLYPYSWAWDVSDDGSVIVGSIWKYSDYYYDYPLNRAFRWRQGSRQNFMDGIAYAVSADGTVVAGRNDDTQYDCDYYGCIEYVAGDYASRTTWSNNTYNTQTRRLGNYSFGHSAFDISADGSIVVGISDDKAFRWTQSGVEDLNVTYANLLTNGSRLISAFAISRNGRYIVGVGYNGATRRDEAFLLDTGSHCTPHNGDADNNGCIDDADLLAVLFAFGNTGSDLGRVDVNCDQTVDDADLLQVLFNFGNGC
jgi:probable HAF family extracellular repeat protein